MPPTTLSDQDLELRRQARSLFDADDSGKPVDLESMERFRTRNAGKPPMKRAGALTPDEDVGLISLMKRSDGVLEWMPGTAYTAATDAGRRAAFAPGAGAVCIDQYRYSRIAPNQVQSILDKLDRKLTPCGVPPEGGADDTRLRRWNGAAWECFDRSTLKGKRVLLFVHGTFSNCSHLVDELFKAPDKAGQAFFQAAAKHYDFVLGFDHPTVGVSPVMNAFDLAMLLQAGPVAVDIICHSRGGLVTRWFTEAFAPPSMLVRAVLVGSPIDGTSLAAPDRQKVVFNYFTNLGATLGKLMLLGAANPFLLAGGTLMTTLCSAASAAINSPVLDGAMMMIPGLQGQSRVSNNPELSRLQLNTGGQGKEYYAVTSDFEPKDPAWAFLKLFSKPVLRAADAGADLLFDEPNDLVVNTQSMTYLSGSLQIPPARTLSYGTNPTVHHVNYFQQAKTIAFLRSSLGF